jgi:hypothetical protein
MVMYNPTIPVGEEKLALIVEKDKVFGEFMEFLEDYSMAPVLK